MSQAPAVLGLHFLLEVAALAALARWGWATHAGATRWLWAIGVPLVAAAAWAVLRAPGDGPAPLVAVPGALRLALELTERERAVLRLVGQGKTNKVIAAALHITERTVEFHVGNVLQKLGAASRVEAALWARDHGLHQ